MAYQVLARKWRPASFDALVGQEHVLKALRHALDTQRTHHAYLFTGTRGVGKTTIARILARCFNCEQGVTASPCGECATCVEISEGRCVDLIEVDAASRTKVEDTRELLDNVQYAPTRARYKVYLIDEVHMLSGHSFNALLKTLEEPPEHVKFLLATTDPQKLPATVLSRCLQFNLKNLSAERIAGYLAEVLEAEGIEADEQALWLLGRAAAGSMRDALSLTDQAIGFGSGRLAQAEVAAMLGTVERSHIFALLDALIADDGAAVLAACAAMDEQGVAFKEALEELTAVLHRIAVAQAVPELSAREFGDAERIVALAAQLTAEDVQLFYQLAVQGRSQVADAAEPRAAFEMLALRLLAFRPLEALDPALQADDLVAPESPPGEVGQGAKKPEPPAAAPPGLSTESPAAAPEAAPVEPTAAVNPAPASTLAAADGELSWTELLERLGLKGSTYNIASHCVLLERREDSWSFCLDEAQANLFNQRHREAIGAALSEWGGRAISVAIEKGAVPSETPARYRQRLRAEAVAAAEVAISEDPRVQRLLEDFDADLVRGSVSVDESVEESMKDPVKEPVENASPHRSALRKGG
jgi:DNA polymerase-3 subunit gamma/tau